MIQTSNPGNPATIKIKGEMWSYLTPRDQGWPVLVRAAQYTTFKSIERQSKVNFHHLYLHRQITGLNSTISPLHGVISRLSPFRRKLILEGGELHYEVREGKVFLQDIKLIARSPTKANSGSGLYQVESDGTRWLPNKTQCKQIETLHAAVNGRADSIKDAADFMPTFINHGYNPNQALKKEAKEKYTLFHNPYKGVAGSDWRCLQDSSGIRGGTAAAQRLAAAMKLAAQDKREINWTVHGRGVAIFKQALRLLSKEGAQLATQRVFYANPMVNIEFVDILRRKVGMQLAPKRTLLNEYSVQQSLLTGNLVSELAVSWRQISEQGEGGKLTRGALVSSAAKRIGLVSALLSLSGGVGAAAWAATALMAATANLAPGYANRRVIEDEGDNLNFLLHSLRGRG